MNILDLLKRLWPVVKNRVTAVISIQIKSLALRSHVTLTDDEALALAALVVGLLEDIIDDKDNVPDHLVARASVLTLEGKAPETPNA